MEFTPEQLAYAREIDLPCRAVAIPGSGKSATLVHKIARILQEHPEARVCAITFTAEGAAELKRRVAKSMGGTEGGRLVVGTFHSIMLNLAKDALEQRGRSLPRLVSERELDRYVARALERAGIPNQRGLRRKIDALRGSAEHYERLLEGQDIFKLLEKLKREKEGAGEALGDLAKHAAAAVDGLLREERVADFSMLLRWVVHEIEKGDGKVHRLNVRNMIVDEAQDMDALQLQFVLLHWFDGVICDLVGDDDQSIYSFRESLGFEGMKRFSEATGSKDFPLSINFRCAPEILSVAATLIEFNKLRIPKTLTAANRPGGKVGVEAFMDRETELMCVAACVKGEFEEFEKRRSIAILCRTNKPLQLMEGKLESFGVPCKRVGGVGFWDLEPAALLLALLRSVAFSEDSGIAVCLHVSGVQEVTISALRKLGGGSIRQALVEKASDAGVMAPEGSEGAGLLREIATKFRGWVAQSNMSKPGRDDGEGKERTQRSGPEVAIEGCADWLLNAGQETAKGKERDWWVDALDTCVQALCKRSGRLAQRLAAPQRRDEREDDKAAVTLVSMHGAKGLEWDSVYVIACEQDQIPNKSLMTTLEEERRLFYVALTRARVRLRVTHAETTKDGKSSSGTQRVAPSQFIGEFSTARDSSFGISLR